MENNIIESPKLVGCLNCSPVPNTKLSKDTTLAMGFGFVELCIDNLAYEVFFNEEEDKTVADIEKEYSYVLKRAEISLLKFNSALHDETYEYSQNDGQWYLVEQGIGFA